MCPFVGMFLCLYRSTSFESLTVRGVLGRWSSGFVKLTVLLYLAVQKLFLYKTSEKKSLTACFVVPTVTFESRHKIWFCGK